MNKRVTWLLKNFKLIREVNQLGTKFLILVNMLRVSLVIHKLQVMNLEMKKMKVK